MVRGDLHLADAKTLAAAREQVEEAGVGHVPLLDGCQAADRLGHGSRPHLASFPDEAHAERLLVLEARLRHLEVALLENLERERAPGKEHGAKGKDGDFHKRGRESFCYSDRLKKTPDPFYASR